ncbi:prenyltransferase/squalene oxidase repeat-containing protein [Singulisphaera sp. PoT]|uniref:prenyltransferase/squalene oxidase repeat-containing protein n=1 Tax=Singulisphaera sp. PoT TaxID=3411797 RepID=UPI003BF4F684
MGLGVSGCKARRRTLLEEMDAALASGLRALIGAQSSNGSWCSKTYGALKDGLSLTGPVLKAILYGPSVPGSERARRLGAEYLARRVRQDGSIDYGPFGAIYPVYSASTAAIVLSRYDTGSGTRPRDAWLADLQSRQLTEDLGWTPDDPAYGAWGYATFPTSKQSIDANAGSPADADLSSTLFALGALGISGSSNDTPAIQKALQFVQRCQNFDEHHSRFADGGFFLSPTDPVRNKAGVAGVDSDGRERYHSYGGPTADGLRALLRCGLSAKHPRVIAARAWLENHFDPSRNPGTFEPIREVERDATYYYTAWSTAHAFRALGTSHFRSQGRDVPWTEELAKALIERQRPDGFWSNRWQASKEDDPLIATPLALGALGICRMLTPTHP